MTPFTGGRLSMNHGCPSLLRRAVSVSQPVSVTRKVCSNCAERLPSCVTDVQLSGHVLSRHVPATQCEYNVSVTLDCKIDCAVKRKIATIRTCTCSEETKPSSTHGNVHTWAKIGPVCGVCTNSTYLLVLRTVRNLQRVHTFRNHGFYGERVPRLHHTNSLVLWSKPLCIQL